MELLDFLKRISFWEDKTDNECVELATNEFGVDAEQALSNMLERDFAVSMKNGLIEELNK